MDLATLAGMASSAGQIAGGISSIAGLFGGGDGASANDLARSQMHYSLMSMKNAPYATVTGLKRAGLNPMLAIGKATPQASVGMPSPVDDRQVSTARGLAAASIANQAAQAKLYSAQAANVEADTANKLVTPALTVAHTDESKMRTGLAGAQTDLVSITKGLQSAQTKLADKSASHQEQLAGKALVEKYLKEFEWAVTKIYGPAKADLIFKTLQSSTQTAETEAASAKGLEDAYKNIPAELVSTIKIIRSIIGK